MKKILILCLLLFKCITYPQKINGRYNWKNSAGETVIINFKNDNTFNYKSYSDLGSVCILNKGFYIKHRDTLNLIYDNLTYSDKIKVIRQSKIEDTNNDNNTKIDFELIDENNNQSLGAIIAIYTSKNKYVKAESYNGKKISFSISSCDNIKYIQITYFTDEMIIPMDEYEGFDTSLLIKLFSEKKCRYSRINKNIKHKILGKTNSSLKLLQIDNNDNSILSKY